MTQRHLTEVAEHLRKFAKTLKQEHDAWRPEYVNWLADQLEEQNYLSPNHQHDLLHILDDASYLLE